LVEIDAVRLGRQSVKVRRPKPLISFM